MLLASMISLIPKGIPNKELSFNSSSSLAFFKAFFSSRYIHAFTSLSFCLILSKQLKTHSYIDNFLFFISSIASVAVNSYGFVMLLILINFKIYT